LFAEHPVSAAAIRVSFGSTVSHSSLAVGNIAIERIGRLSHTAQKVGHIVRCNAIPKMLRHPDCHLIVQEIISKELFEAVDVLNVPNGATWHLKGLATPLRLSNSDPNQLISSTNINNFRRLMFREEGVCQLPRKLNLSQFLRDARIKRGLSVAEVAEQVGVSQASIYFWENNRVRPRDANLTALCKVLKLPVRATKAMAIG